MKIFIVTRAGAYSDNSPVAVFKTLADMCDYFDNSIMNSWSPWKWYDLYKEDGAVIAGKINAAGNHYWFNQIEGHGFE